MKVEVVINGGIGGIAEEKKVMQKLRSTRINDGEYRVNDQFFVSRTADGWRWVDGDDVSLGGEWRASKREAMADLLAHVVATRPTLADLIEQGRDPRKRR